MTKHALAAPPSRSASPAASASTSASFCQIRKSDHTFLKQASAERAANSSAFLVTSFYASPRSLADPLLQPWHLDSAYLLPKDAAIPSGSCVSPFALWPALADFASPAVAQDFTKCMQDDGTKQPSQCKLLAEDYIECLHHHKQVLLSAARTAVRSISHPFKILKLKRIAIETEKYKEAVAPCPPTPPFPRPPSAFDSFCRTEGSCPPLEFSRLLFQFRCL